MVDNKDWPH